MASSEMIHHRKRLQARRRSVDETDIAPSAQNDIHIFQSPLAMLRRGGDAPLNASTLLHLQRMVGNRAVNRLVKQRAGQRVQRTYITIEKIDYDPDAADFIDGRIRHQFFADVAAGIRADEAFTAAYRNRLNQVLDRVQEADEIKGQDAKVVIDLLLNAFISAYNSFSVTAWGGALRAKLRAIIENALQNNIVPIPKHTLDAGERSEFDTLVNIVGRANMSREKGVPTDIPFDSLPSAIKSAAQTVKAGIATEKTLWPLNIPTLPYERINLDMIRAVVMSRLPRYQGNHSNKAGWLTDNPMPANWLDTTARTIFDNASSPLKGKLLKKDAQSRIDSNSKLKAEYTQLFTAATAGKTGADLLRMVWLAATSGISPYVEFSLSGTSISRMMYNVITGEYYITAHYKWADAYNPFFHLT